ncbi:MAG TPA: DUF4087 domain-containing protein [Pyrinomonadaceae bacterium]
MMMKKLVKLQSIIIGYLLLAAVAFVSGHPGLPVESEATQFETRCGWLDNPTPANLSLFDRDGEWIIGVQGGHQVEGDWEWPTFRPRQWVSTNAGSYGYGCACLQLRVDKETHKVLEIKSARARLLSVCRRDRSLKRWRHMFK